MDIRKAKKILRCYDWIRLALLILVIVLLAYYSKK